MPTIYNKVEVNGNTLIDLSTDTITSAEHIVAGYVGHLANGTVVTGIGQGASTPNLQSKTATPTESVQTITADSGYDGLSSVEVGAIDSKYIGSGVTRISSNSGITINGATVTVAGQAYWTGNISKTIPLQSKTATPTESVQTITADSNYSGLSSVEIGAISSTYVGSGIARKTFTQADALGGLDGEGGYIFMDAGYYADDATINVGTANSNNKPTISIDSATGLITSSIDIGSGWVTTGNAGTRTTTQQLTTQGAKTVTPTESSQTAVAAGVYTTGAVTVGAISSTYVGSGITQRDGDDLTASGATVTVPAGYYSSQATKSVASGSAGTPTATKGTVSNHSIIVTPSVTNTTGYITGGTKSGTGVTVSASELVSGSQTIVANRNNIDVTNLASVNVAVPVESGGDYTRLEILPLQSFTADSSQKRATLTGLSEGFTDGGYYVVTYDGAEWLVTCEILWSSDYTIGQSEYFLNTSAFASTEPFGIIWTSGTNCTIAIGDTSQHTVKIEKLEFVNPPSYQSIYTGTGTPSSSMGSNGDIYVKTS